MMSKRSIKDISADQEKLVANVLVDLLGRDHKALKVEKSDLTSSVETESHKMDMLSSDEAIIGFSKPDNIVRLREFLVEWTGQHRLSVNNFKMLSSGYEAEVVFPCKAVEELLQWTTSFEEAIHCPFRATRVEKVPTGSRLNLFKAKRKCACKRNIKDKNGVRGEEPCNAVIKMALLKNGFAHICLFMQHNHGLSDFGTTKYCRPHLTRDQKEAMIDLFQAGLTPVEVIEFLKTSFPCNKTFPGCTAMSCVTQNCSSTGFSCSDMPFDISYRQVYHLFHKFKKESKGNFDIDQLRFRLDAEIDQFRQRVMRSPKLITSTLCFLNFLSSKCDHATSDILLNCMRKKADSGLQKNSMSLPSDDLMTIDSFISPYHPDMSHSSYHQIENIILDDKTPIDDYDEQIIIVDDAKHSDLHLAPSRQPFFVTSSNPHISTTKTASTEDSRGVSKSIFRFQKNATGVMKKPPSLKLNKKIESLSCNNGGSSACIESERPIGSPSLLLDVSRGEVIPTCQGKFTSIRVTSSPVATVNIPSMSFSQSPNIGSLSQTTVDIPVVATSLLPPSGSKIMEPEGLQETISLPGDSKRQEGDGASFSDVFCTPKSGDPKTSMLDISLEPVCSTTSSVDALDTSFSLDDLFRTPQGSKFKMPDEVVSAEESPLTSLLSTSNRNSNSMFVTSDVTNEIQCGNSVVDHVLKVSSKIGTQSSPFNPLVLRRAENCNVNEMVNHSTVTSESSTYTESIDVNCFQNGLVESEIEIE